MNYAPTGSPKNKLRIPQQCYSRVSSSLLSTESSDSRQCQLAKDYVRCARVIRNYKLIVVFSDSQVSSVGDYGVYTWDPSWAKAPLLLRNLSFESE